MTKKIKYEKYSTCVRRKTESSALPVCLSLSSSSFTYNMHDANDERRKSTKKLYIFLLLMYDKVYKAENHLIFLL